jgi:hypothetical protein
MSETQVPDGWQGTPPAEGTRRKLILDVIENELLGSRNAERCLAITDAVEAALLKVVDQGASPESGSPASVAMDVLGLAAVRNPAADEEDFEKKLEEAGHIWRKGSPERRRIEQKSKAASGPLLGEEVAKALNHLILARRECVDPAELARINKAITAAHMVVEPPAYAAVAEAVDKEVAVPPVNTDDPDCEDDVLGQREEARTRESRFAEERDCAFALLRWLLPVTVAKRVD